MNLYDPNGLWAVGSTGPDPTDRESQPCFDPSKLGINNYWDYVENFANTGCIIGSAAGISMQISRRAGSVSPPQSKNCEGEARVLQGNADLIGKAGGFSGDSVGTFPITGSGAAIILSQWHSTKSGLRPYIGQISGSGPGWSFSGIDDIVGGTPPPGYSNVQTGLMALNPGKLILELPGAPKDFGVTTVRLTIPIQLDCPDGTKEVK